MLIALDMGNILKLIVGYEMVVDEDAKEECQDPELFVHIPAF